MDLIGEVLWFLMFATPLLTVPLVLYYSRQKVVIRILLGLLCAFLLSYSLYFLSLTILFRNGMGP